MGKKKLGHIYYKKVKAKKIISELFRNTKYSPTFDVLKIS